MKRKIIKQGHNTLTLTLPSDWTKKLNLQAGDEIDIFENSGSLVVNGKQHNKKSTVTIDITGFSVPMVWRFFQSAYREGYEEIKLVYDQNKKIRKVPLIFIPHNLPMKRWAKKNNTSQ